MNCIVNVTEDWGIGLNNELLVTISADLRRFRQLTTGKTVILGRKTLATFPGGKPLKNRKNLILSTDLNLQIEDAQVVHSVEDVLNACSNDPDACVIGGASVYELLLPYCHTAQITRTLGTYPSDRFFPNLDNMSNWVIAHESEIMEENGIRFQYIDYINQEFVQHF